MQVKDINRENQNEYIFFSMNDFLREGGDTIRMYGILNSLANLGVQIIFISNAQDYSKFHSSIIHRFIDFKFTKEDKRKFQLFTAFSTFLTNKYYDSFLNRLNQVFKPYTSNNIYFFEYLDNSIGFWLYQNKIVHSYSNDIHGIATLEFQYTYKNSKTLRNKIINFLKFKTAQRLDRKVLSHAKYNIYVSKAMENYYLELYPEIKKNKSIIIPNLINSSICETPFKVNEKLKQEISAKLSLYTVEKVILFAGGFKTTAGVLELIKAVQYCIDKNHNIKLLLIGDGPSEKDSREYVEKNNLNLHIHFLGRIPYQLLTTYQSIANILVCPDQMNEYSDKIIHLKYFDALLANKVVINGNFKSVLEINNNESLSLGFDPSSQHSLNETLLEAIENYDYYKSIYQNTRSIVCKNLTYNSFINKLPTN